MNQMVVQELERNALIAVTKALAASAKLDLEREELVQNLALALHIDDETMLGFIEAASQDPEALELQKYDHNILRAPSNAGTTVMAASMQPIRPSAATSRPQAVHAAQPAAMYAQPIDPYAMPAAKKQKKSGAGTMGPPATLPRQGSTPTGSKQGGSSKSKARSAPTTPVGTIVAAPQAFKPQPMKPVKPTISPASLQRVITRTLPEMEAYAQELNNREREIFTELIGMGVDENDPELKELPRALLQWYKLDMRQGHLEAEIAA